MTDDFSFSHSILRWLCLAVAVGACGCGCGRRQPRAAAAAAARGFGSEVVVNVCKCWGAHPYAGVGRRCYSLSVISQFFEFRFRALPCRRPTQGETSTGRPLFGYIVSRMVVDKAPSVTELPSTPQNKTVVQ
jgi:hypothetical protein